MTHAEMNEAYELYALGLAEPEAAAEIERHLDEQCAYCRERVSAALALSAALAQVADPVAPPARLRERVLASVSRPQTAARKWNFGVLALAAAYLALLLFAIASQRSLRDARAELSVVTQERNQLRSAVEVLSRPETRTVEFGRTENVAHGRVLVNRNGGFVFVASRMPQLTSSQTYELWLVPANGAAPQPAGLFRPDAAGNSVQVSEAAVDPTTTKAVAVSVEPKQGSSAPTTTPILVVPLG
jgi:anti-sigma-K factor RskA